ncbi:MAG: IS1634 family transposase [Candidatus Loosdrechtia sp.]|uniref:IS1634 family transposase n=1 Tax=Candidatus Loosdrechtia sp. TaxID=3101272 RepID=UPI003A654E73|nr:MAG: IS1634 family transposase [Candidatus Jettenia sp. AMX2]
MYVRKKSKKTSGKKRYLQHQLVESVRTPSGPRQQIVLNLGQLDLPEEKWKVLADRIEGILTNQKTLFPLDPEIEAKARHYARQIRQERLGRGQECLTAEETAHYEQVDISSLATNDAKTVGAEHVVISQMDEYGFDTIVKGLGLSEEQVKYSRMVIVGRIVHPGSERETARWLTEASGVGELLGGGVRVYDNALHRAAILLWEHHEAIERELSRRAREIYSLKETVILYDLTNSYFEGSKRGSKIARYGKSKEKRNDCPIITLSLTVDEEGFPKQSKVWEGNVSEPDTLKDILSGLKKEGGLFTDEKTIVIDAGIATEDNIALIKKNGFRYVAVSRKRTYEDAFWSKAEEEKIPLSDGKTTLSLKFVRTEEEAYLLCHSETKEAKEKAMLFQKEQRFEQELLSIREGLSKAKRQRKYDKIIERIGRLKERYNVGNLYKIKVEQSEGNATLLHFTKNEQAKAKEDAAGTYVLRTNRLDLGGEEISKLHRSLTTIEASFASMKGNLGLRPNFHHADTPTIAHVHVTVLAYHILAGIIKKLRTAGIHYDCDTIRNILATHVRVTTTMNTEDGHVIDVRTCTTPTEKQHMIYHKLQIKHTPLGRKYIKTPVKTQRCSAEK